MKESAIKGTGNSRYLKSAITEATTWEEFRDALIAGTLPVDLAGINEDGFQQLGDPLNKKTLLQDLTAALYGSDATAVPDEIFNRILNLIPSPYGVLAIKVVDGDGNIVPAQLTISPAIEDTSTFFTDANGFFRTLAPVGTYTVSVVASIFTAKTDASSASVTVQPGQVVQTELTVSPVEHGEAEITESVSLAVPFSVSVDFFAVAGGGSGAVHYTTSSNTDYSQAGGGAGGQTKQSLGNDLGGKVLDIIIGAGGIPASLESINTRVHGNAGGDTTITARDGSYSLAAAGGEGGWAGYSTARGGNGGSGGGSPGGNGGTDGGDSGDTTISGDVYTGGTGQGTTTRAWGAADGALYSGGGGGALYGSSTSKRGVGTGGADGGGNGCIDETPAGMDATFYGSGGGAYAYKSSDGVTKTSGAGYQGIVLARW